MEECLMNPFTGEKEGKKEKEKLDAEMGKLLGEVRFYRESLDLSPLGEKEIEMKLYEIASSFVSEGRKELPLLIFMASKGGGFHDETGKEGDTASLLLLARYIFLPHFDGEGRLDEAGKEAAVLLRDFLKPKVA